ncbi:hypothetical protein B4U80_02960 [Leptotrombidium deliense]|uniref:Uncharacterized protein n=1 Tax=Leptotrombidium deliense TaxID=299467 RepID=A0A443RUX8_9ACAR|nr:hypothetical protein B4U80_02960 [Leptotrombidium deliense]
MGLLGYVWTIDD